MELLRKVWSIAKRPADSSPAELVMPAPDHALYVVGDIHGRDDLLAELISRVEEDIFENDVEDARIVLVGDYVDRGDESAEVLRRVHALETRQDLPLTCLTGNHEEMMLKFLDRPGSGLRWLRNGGLQTLASFGISGVSDASGDETLEAASKALAEAMGPDLAEWLRGLSLTYRTGNVVVVHAAMDPEFPVDEQDERTMIWGHSSFLRSARDDDFCIVHGHTIVDQAALLPSRIPVDTGAVFTGRLTAAVLIPGEGPRFIETGEGRA